MSSLKLVKEAVSSEKALLQLFKENIRMIQVCSGVFPGIRHEDLELLGLEIVWEAARSFNHSLSNAFSTYLWMRAIRAFSVARRQEEGYRSLPKFENIDIEDVENKSLLDLTGRPVHLPRYLCMLREIEDLLPTEFCKAVFRLKAYPPDDFLTFCREHSDTETSDYSPVQVSHIAEYLGVPEVKVYTVLRENIKPLVLEVTGHAA